MRIAHLLPSLCFGVALSIHASPAAARPVAPPEAWVVQFDAGGVVDLHLLCQGRRVVSGFALATDRNTPWFAGAQKLTLSREGRLTGMLTLTPGPDLVARVSARAGKKVKAGPPSAEELALDLTAKEGRITGTITAAKKSATGILGRNAASVAARGWTHAEAAADDAQVELMPLGVGSRGAAGLDALGGGVVLRLHLRGGKVHAAKLLPTYRGESPADLPKTAGLELVPGTKLTGRIPLRFEPVTKNGVALDGTLSLDGAIIGDYAAGTAKWESGAETANTCFRARVSRPKHRMALDFRARTWGPQGKPLKADPALAAQARKESLQPIRPGEPGKQPFYSTRPVHLRKFYALYAPMFAFAEVKGASKYRIVVTPARGVRGGPWSFEAEKPWAPLTPIWKDVPAGPLTVSAVGLGAGGEEVGRAEVPETVYRYVGGDPRDEKGIVHWSHPNRARQVAIKGKTFPALKDVRFTKRAPFEGPYWAPRRTAKESALAAARWVRDDPGRAHYRGLWGWGGFTGGDGGDNVGIASMVMACCQVARLSDDPHERREAVALARRMAWRMDLAHEGRLPVVYKGNAALMIWLGHAYLDTYEASKDERFRVAARDLAKALADSQHEDGGWPGGPKAVWPGGVFGPSEFRTNGAEPVLWFLGRRRKELGTRDFVKAEDRANRWVRQNCLPALTWQNVGYHSGEMVLVQDTVAPHALAYCTWLLDHAEGNKRDVKLAADIARWCEERHVDWSRSDDPAVARPSCWGWSRAAGTGVRVAGSLAYVCARLWQETKDPLWKAKAEALVHGIQSAQDPVCGGYAYHSRRSTEDTANNHAYDAVEAARCVVAVAELLAGGPRRSALPFWLDRSTLKLADRKLRGELSGRTNLSWHSKAVHDFTDGIDALLDGDKATGTFTASYAGDDDIRPQGPPHDGQPVRHAPASGRREAGIVRHGRPHAQGPGPERPPERFTGLADDERRPGRWYGEPCCW